MRLLRISVIFRQRPHDQAPVAAGRPRVGFRERQEQSSLLQCTQAGFGVHAISYRTRIHSSLLVVMRTGRDAVHSPPSKAETHAVRISTSGDFSVSGVPSSTHKAYFLTRYAVSPTNLLLLFKH